MMKYSVFTLISILLLIFTLKRQHRHRFSRFFAFESLFVLVLINIDFWFRNFFSFLQVISWIFLTSSLVLAIHSFYLLWRRGLPEDDIEETTQIVTTGAFRYIRHPLYCTLLLAGIGVYLKNPCLLCLIFLFMLVGFVFLTAKIEEDENIERFGEEYLYYIKTTKMFIPHLF